MTTNNTTVRRHHIDLVNGLHPDWRQIDARCAAVMA